MIAPLTLSLLGRSAWAQSSSDPLVIPKLSGPVELDGRLDEAAWDEARRLEAVQHAPTFGEAPSEQTEFLIGYTDEHIYAACRCQDQGPLLTPSFKRDYFHGDIDQFSIAFDSFNDNENALIFLTSPTGLRTDLVTFDDATGQFPFDVSWNTFWSTEARMTKNGWVTEMRIPVSSLRFNQNEDGQVIMGLALVRYIPRRTEVSMFPAIPPKWGTWSWYKPSQYRDVVFEDLEPKTPLRITPYALGGLEQRSELNTAGTAYEQATDPTYDAGLDIKYGLTPNFTLDLTLNTDFAQVEADNQQVNLTRFPLFFPEKRRFFLERSSTFAFGFGQPNRLFYSRRIGLVQGRQVRILGGARVVGRTGPWDVGVLAMQTAREPDIRRGGEALPSEHFGVARLQREVINEDSQVGGIWTSRVGLDGTYNLAYGLDGIFRIHGQQYLTAKWAQTFADGRPNEPFSFDPARIHLQWEDRSYEGFNYDLRFDQAGRRYEPGVGLELRDNYYRFGDRLGYGWVPGEESPIHQHRLNAEGEVYFWNADGTLQSLELGPEWKMITNTGHSLTLEASRRTENLQAPFVLSSQAQVPPGRYEFGAGEIRYDMSRRWNPRSAIEATGGGFYDGWRATVQASPVWSISKYLRLTGFYQLNWIGFPNRNQEFTAHIGRLRAELTPNVEYSLAAFVQYNSTRDLTIANVRFRYNPRQGNDFYLVYNERINTSRAATGPSPRLPRTAQRALLLKYNHTFNF